MGEVETRNQETLNRRAKQQQKGKRTHEGEKAPTKQFYVLWGSHTRDCKTFLWGDRGVRGVFNRQRNRERATRRKPSPVTP